MTAILLHTIYFNWPRVPNLLTWALPGGLENIYPACPPCICQAHEALLKYHLTWRSKAYQPMAWGNWHWHAQAQTSASSLASCSSLEEKCILPWPRNPSTWPLLTPRKRVIGGLRGFPVASQLDKFFTHQKKRKISVRGGPSLCSLDQQYCSLCCPKKSLQPQQHTTQCFFFNVKNQLPEHLNISPLASPLEGCHSPSMSVTAPPVISSLRQPPAPAGQLSDHT